MYSLLEHHAGNSDCLTGPPLNAESLSSRFHGNTASVAVGVKTPLSSKDHTTQNNKHNVKRNFFLKTTKLRLLISNDRVRDRV